MSVVEYVEGLLAEAHSSTGRCDDPFQVAARVLIATGVIASGVDEETVANTLAGVSFVNCRHAADWRATVRHERAVALAEQGLLTPVLGVAR